MSYATAEDPKRPVLNYVRVGKGEIVGCDGLILARRPLPGTEEHPYALVPSIPIRRAKKRNALGQVVVSISDGGPTQIIGKEVESVELGDGTYPNVDQLMPVQAAQVKICLGPTVLKKLLDVAGDDANYIKLEYLGKPYMPLRFMAGDTTGIIMPLLIRAELKEERWKTH